MTEVFQKTALVTGASGGIGKAIALRLAQVGWHLVLHASRDAARLATLKDACEKYGVGVRLWVDDLAQAGAGERFLAALGKDVGIVGYVHVAGVTGEGLAARMKSQALEAAMRVNLMSGMELITALSRGMLAARWGRVVFVGSTVALSGNAGQSTYGASKLGQVGYVRSLARELGSRNVTANVIAPGWIETDMTLDILNRKRQELEASVPLGRIGRPDDVAAAVGFLLSDDAGYITGQTICVNGGLWMV